MSAAGTLYDTDEIYEAAFKMDWKVAADDEETPALAVYTDEEVAYTLCLYSTQQNITYVACLWLLLSATLV